ncbi:hypothetical protein BGY98DRAFT_1095093 [Russula aff. rugulosa BPL654]|nr:hypothetical protein BGY98DRAFT_1095093 [Russula aff. rugulosa BPL654]
MSGTESGALPAQPDEAQISSLVSSVVLKAKESNSLSSLTPRLVRSEVENKLELPSGTLDSPGYKALVKRTIHDAIQREQTSGEGSKEDGKISRNASKLKAGKSGHSSASKSIKSKEIITDSELEDGPNLSAPQLKAGPGTKMDNRKEEKQARSNSKAKLSKVDPKPSKDISPSAKVAPSGSKRKLPPEPVAQSDADAENYNTTSKVSSSPRRITDNQKSDSELSSLVDEPSKKKARGKSKSSEAGKPPVKSKRSKQTSHTLSKDEETIKRLKSLVVACGVRKQWARELDGLNPNAQIAQIRKILNDLGMVGRLSMEQAREIRAQRELAQELDDVQKFERAIVSGKPFKTESTSRRLAKSSGNNADDDNDISGSGSESEFADHEPPKINNARRSIMAFLQDQSSDDE